MVVELVRAMRHRRREYDAILISLEREVANQQAILNPPVRQVCKLFLDLGIVQFHVGEFSHGAMFTWKWLVHWLDRKSPSAASACLAVPKESWTMTSTPATALSFDLTN